MSKLATGKGSCRVDNEILNKMKVCGSCRHMATYHYSDTDGNSLWKYCDHDNGYFTSKANHETCEKWEIWDE
jgi:hypothetical protein